MCTPSMCIDDLFSKLPDYHFNLIKTRSRLESFDLTQISEKQMITQIKSHYQFYLQDDTRNDDDNIYGSVFHSECSGNKPLRSS